MIKVGDKIKIVRLEDDNDHKLLKLGSEHIVTKLETEEKFVYIDIQNIKEYLLLLRQVELVEETEETKEIEDPEKYQIMIRVVGTSKIQYFNGKNAFIMDRQIKEALKTGYDLTDPVKAAYSGEYVQINVKMISTITWNKKKED